MANIREIKGRMNSIQDTMKITNAMYMISSTKLRKAKKNLEDTEPYFYTLRQTISRVCRHLPDMDNKYFDHRPDKSPEERTAGIVLITADKGLAGSYNHNVIKYAEEEMKKHSNCKLFVVGELGRQYFTNKGIPIAGEFHYTSQNPSLHRARIISETVLAQFLDDELDDVYVIYTDMKSSVSTEPAMIKLLPVSRDMVTDPRLLQAGIYQEEIEFYPSADAVLNNVVPDCVMGYMYSALVESFCSEQNARMMAMEAANKSATEMIHSLAIEYNRVRQAMITQEITEVISGAKSQKKKKQARKEVS